MNTLEEKLRTNPVIACYAGREFIFPNIKECAKYFGLTRQTIYNKIKSENKNKFLSFKTFCQDGSFNKEYYEPEELTKMLEQSDKYKLYEYHDYRNDWIDNGIKSLGVYKTEEK